MIEIFSSAAQQFKLTAVDVDANKKPNSISRKKKI